MVIVAARDFNMSIYQIAPTGLNVPDHHVAAWYFGCCEKRVADFVGTRWQLRNHVLKCNGYDHTKTNQDMLLFVPRQCTSERCRTALLLCPAAKVDIAIEAVKRKALRVHAENKRKQQDPRDAAVSKLQEEFHNWMKEKSRGYTQLHSKTA